MVRGSAGQAVSKPGCNLLKSHELMAGHSLFVMPVRTVRLWGRRDDHILPDVPRSELGQTVKDLLSTGLEAVERSVVSARLPVLEITAEKDIFINLDGEPISGRHFKIQVMPQALRLHLPATSSLLGASD
jgi:hypothetical protein